ncbi:hypothetical protein AURDEDRAFT_114105 [Auricularia subglabra TFB-10046 SS5]|nr:hypothetical protein AURDEDRAFT_114105 [Auricularia subglabra TFB-10046 SS5]
MATNGTQNDTAAPSVVSTTLNYFTPPADGSAPYTKADRDPVTGKQDMNWVCDAQTVQIEDIRGHEDEYKLDVSGFEYHTGPTALKHEDFADDDTITRVYYPESEDYLKKVTGAKRVVLFDHTVRRHRPGEVDSDAKKRQPVPQVHGDQTARSARVRVRRHLPADDAEQILAAGTRFQIINLWRPIGHPAIDLPLALSDFRSIDAANDLVPQRIVFATYEGETLGVKYSENHRWKYVRGMRPDEFVLIKCYDSAHPDVSLMTAHTAFTDPTTPKDAPPRESIELRALLFH